MRLFNPNKSCFYFAVIGILSFSVALAKNTKSFQKTTLIEEDDSPVNQEFEDPKEESAASVPLETNQRVEKWIKYFSINDRARFQRFIDRGHRYRTLVEGILVSNGLPRELYNLALIESGYRRRARSTAAAVGIWQFIPGTAKRYGLVVSRDLDERHDPVRATEAASKYLQDLYNIFGSWHLAMAAYNAGEYRVLSAVVRGKSRDFWELADLKVLPRETIEYVPKFIAATFIDAQLREYGFKQPDGESFPEVKPIAVPTMFTIAGLSLKFGIQLKKFKDLNPQIKSHRLPTRFKKLEVWVPREVAVSRNWQTVFASYRQYKRPRSKNISYRVKRGDNLVKIAKRFGVTVTHIQSKNNHAGHMIRIGQLLRIAPKKL